MVPAPPVQPDDQDRHLNYYTPMVDIFMRPRLPSLRGPLALAIGGAICHCAPGKALYQLAMNQALYHSRNTFKSAVLHLLGNSLKYGSWIIGDFALKTPSLVTVGVCGYLGEKMHATAHSLLKQAATLAAPKIMSKAQTAQVLCQALNIIAKPIVVSAGLWAMYVMARHYIEPAPYDAPPGTYPNGGPIIEITQEEAANKEMVFTCPAPLARQVQERVLLCERDPTLIQKVKSIASKWCDQNNITGNQRYQAVSGAVAAALTVPCIEQNVIQLATSHAVQQQYHRIANYIQQVKHRADPWWTKYMLIRR